LSPRLGDRPGALRDRSEQRDLLRLLEGAEAAQTEGHRAADQEHRAPGGVCVGDSGDRVGDPRARNDDRDAHAARQPRVRIGRVGGRLLVAHVDDADTFGETAVVDQQDVATAQGEDVAHPRLPECSGDQLTARQIGHVAVRRALSAT
jgi:hypothetical protein